jgi:hypothetical protein
MGSIQNESESKVEGLGFKVSMGQTACNKGGKGFVWLK